MERLTYEEHLSVISARCDALESRNNQLVDSLRRERDLRQQAEDAAARAIARRESIAAWIVKAVSGE